MSALERERATGRVRAFVVVGAIGFVLQIGLLQLLLDMWHWPYLAATAVAVEAAVLNNFLWHERWTWKDRSLVRDNRTRLGQLMRFHVSNGLTSIFGNVVVTAAAVEFLHLPPAVANALGVVAVSVANYLSADRWVFASASSVGPRKTSARRFQMEDWRTHARESAIVHRPGEVSPAADLPSSSVPARQDGRAGSALSVPVPAAVVAVACALAIVTPIRVSAQPQAETLAAWNRHVSQVEAAWHPKHSAPVETGEPVGETIRIEGGTINQWRGAVLLRDTSVETLVSSLQNPGLPPPAEDILDARVLHRGDHSLRVYMKLARTAIITVTYDTEHDVTFARLGQGLATSRSVATSIREEGGGDRGFLWQLNSYWTYRQVGRDVRVELVSVSLSRNVPALARPIASPIVTRIARESTVRALEALRRFGERRG